MKKELVTIEFRYNDAPKGEVGSGFTTKTITIGVFDTLEEAIIEGNKALEVFESKFKLHVFPSGTTAKKERFSKNGGCFGTANKLVTQLAYLKTPFEFYAKITTLNYADISTTISEVLNAGKRYKEFTDSQNNQ